MTRRENAPATDIHVTSRSVTLLIIFLKIIRFKNVLHRTFYGSPRGTNCNTFTAQGTYFLLKSPGQEDPLDPP